MWVVPIVHVYYQFKNNNRLTIIHPAHVIHFAGTRQMWTIPDSQTLSFLHVHERALALDVLHLSLIRAAACSEGCGLAPM